MNWKLKSILQNSIALVPSPLSYSLYYWTQKKFGGLKAPDPLPRILLACDAWKKIISLGFEPKGKTFFEVGTGRAPLVPIAYFLMGAENIITVDINPYLKEELLRRDLAVIFQKEEEIKRIFGAFLVKSRWSKIKSYFQSQQFNLDKFLKISNIQYFAPADASKTTINHESIDYHTSCAVFEHIPRKKIIDILIEGNRITKNDGLFLHVIDYTDHFSHTDKSISPINFLSFSDKKWNLIAGNKYMYANRMRHDDFIMLFEEVGHKILLNEPSIDQNIQKLLNSNKILLNERFSQKSIEILSTTGAWIGTRKINRHKP